MSKHQTLEQILSDDVSEIVVSTASVKKDYKLGKTIGTGAFSVVLKATHKATGQKVAIKVVRKDSLKNGGEEIMREAGVLTKIDHDNVIRLYDIREDKKNFYLIMELVEGAELFEKIVKRGNYSERDARNIMRQVVEAIQYMHSKNICHRDLKPENLLCHVTKEGQEIVKVADFGFSKSFDEELLQTRVGTPGYVAPEVLSGNPYGQEVDMWSVGVILYILLSGYPPFREPAVLRKIVECQWAFDHPDWELISADAKHVISRLLVKNPSDRMTPEEMLASDWMTGGDISDKQIELLKLKEYHSQRKLALENDQPKLKVTIQDSPAPKRHRKHRRSHHHSSSKKSSSSSSSSKSRSRGRSHTAGSKKEATSSSSSSSSSSKKSSSSSSSSKQSTEK